MCVCVYICRYWRVLKLKMAGNVYYIVRVMVRFAAPRSSKGYVDVDPPRTTIVSKSFIDIFFFLQCTAVTLIRWTL